MKTKIYIAALATALALTACDSDWTPAIDGGGRTGRLAPTAGSLVADLFRLFSFIACGNIEVYFIAFLPIVNP